MQMYVVVTYNTVIIIPEGRLVVKPSDDSAEEYLGLF